jgi:hypothetical protein
VDQGIVWLAGALAATVLSSCAARPRGVRQEAAVVPTPVEGAAKESANDAKKDAKKDAIVWRYEVRLGPGPREDLAVEGRFEATTSDDSGDFEVDSRAAPFVHDVEYAKGTGWVRAGAGSSGWSVPCGGSGCEVRYRFALRDAVGLGDLETAIASDDVIVAPPSTWLLRPSSNDARGRFRFHVAVAPPSRFTAGTRPAPTEASYPAGAREASERPDTFEASVDDLDASSFAVFGPFHGATIESGAARVEVAIAPHGLTLSDAETVAWIRSAVDAVAAYFRGFPASRALVVVMAGRGAPTRGETLGDGGPGVLLRAGDGLRASTMRDDWVATHELLHVSLPSLSRGHAWLSEGIASYVEPIVRVRAGLTSAETVWRELVEGLPQGLPGPGDEGLERTHTWGRTYWGGALFCLAADVAVREHTNNARSFDDVVRAAAKIGGDVETHWEIDRWLDEGDRATGTRVLHDLYRDMGLAPGTVDLAALWSRLGVRVHGKTVSFDEGAPLAAVRRAIIRDR